MKTLCKNDCTSDAHWYCKKCDANYCIACVEKKKLKIYKNESDVHVCPQCKRILKWTGMGEVIESETEGLKASLLFPFSLNVLPALVVIFTVSLLFSTHLLLNEVVYCFVSVILQSYSLSVLQKTISGGKTPPKITVQLLKHVDFRFVLRVFKYSLFYFAISTMFYWVFIAGEPILSLIFLAPAFFLPYAIMKSMTARSFKDYWNVELLLAIVKKNRAYYPATVLLFYMIFSIFPLFTYCPPVTIIPVILYAMIVSHRIIGKMVIKNHLELEYTIGYNSFKERYSSDKLQPIKG